MADINEYLLSEKVRSVADKINDDAAQAERNRIIQNRDKLASMVVYANKHVEAVIGDRDQTVKQADEALGRYDKYIAALNAADFNTLDKEGLRKLERAQYWATYGDVAYKDNFGEEFAGF